jgi:glycosyltransferase involved in cell wall biosynthesis
MPVWRPREAWLRAAVESVLAQGDSSFELVIVDDGCEQPVADLLADVGDARLRIHRVAHGGVYAARNVGLDVAQGDWIRYVDADDILAAGSTRRLLDLSSGARDIVTYGATTFCDEDLRPRWTMRSRLQGRIATDCLLGRFTVRPQALLFPRVLLEATDGWSSAFRVSGDWDFVLRVLEGARVRGETTVALYYRRHPGGVTADSDAGLEGAHLVVERYLERHPEARGTRLELRARGMLHALSARTKLTRGELPRAVRDLARALETDPIAVVEEVRRSLPALAGQLRHRLMR